MGKYARLWGKKGCLAVLAIALCLLVGGVRNAPAAEQGGFPNKTIKVIVPQSPGGALDMEPRGFLPYLSKKLGVDILIENMPGAGGKMGLSKCWKAKPDGYTLLYHGIPQSIMSEYLFQTEYKTNEFTHVFGLLSTNMVLLVHPDRWKTMEEFLKYAREKTVVGGLPSPGSTSHICGLVSVDKLGMKVNWIPYNGSSEVLTGIAGKHLDFGIISTNSAQAMVSAGRLRPLMVYAEGPDASFPDVPFPEKLGYKMTTMAAIRGFVAPPATPAKLVKTLSDAMFSTVDNQDFVAWTKRVKLEILPLSGSKYLAATNEQYATLETYKKLFKNQ